MLPPVQFGASMPRFGERTYSRTATVLSFTLLGKDRFDLPMPLLDGPRTVGKTTALHQAARRIKAEVRSISLDRIRTPDEFKSEFKRAANNASAKNPVLIVLDDIDGIDDKALCAEVVRQIDRYRESPHVFLAATARNIWGVNSMLYSRMQRFDKVEYYTPTLPELEHWPEFHPISAWREDGMRWFLN